MSTLPLNRVKALTVLDVNGKQVAVLCHKGESVPTFLRVEKNIQKNTCPCALKGAQALVDILGAIEYPQSMNLEGCDR